MNHITTTKGRSGFVNASAERCDPYSSNRYSTVGQSHAVADLPKTEKASILLTECREQGFTIFGWRCGGGAIAKAESMALGMLTEESQFAMNGAIPLKRSMNGR